MAVVLLVAIVAAAGVALVRHDAPKSTAKAMSGRLSGDGIVHYAFTGVQRNAASSQLGKVVRIDSDQWFDIRSTANHWVNRATSDGKAVADLTGRSWFDGDRTGWSYPTAPTPPGHRIKVTKIVSPLRRHAGTAATPISQLRASLQAVVDGKATLRDGENVGGRSAVEVTERFGRRNEISGTTTSWITRDGDPRLLRQVIDQVDAKGRFMSRDVTTVTTWKVFPASDVAARAAVAVPTFDPAKYVVDDLFGHASGNG